MTAGFNSKSKMASQQPGMGHKDDWKSDNFRHKVLNQMKDAFEKAGVEINSQTYENMEALEHQVFSKATKREEYMALVAKLILHVTSNRRMPTPGVPAPDASPVPGLPYVNAARMLGKQSPPTANLLGRQNYSQAQIPGMQQPPPPSHVPSQVPPHSQMPSVPPNSSSSSGSASSMRVHAPSPASQMSIPYSPASSLHQAAPSPAQLVAASPSAQLIPPSPAPPHPASNTGVPSPSLNPASVGPVNSPAGPVSAAEEQIYWEKHRQLSKYIVPLRKMIDKMTQDESKGDGSIASPLDPKMSKLKSLMDILTSTKRKVPLKTLEKCEIALQKLDEGTSDPPTGSTSTADKQNHPDLEKMVADAVAKSLPGILASYFPSGSVPIRSPATTPDGELLSPSVLKPYYFFSEEGPGVSLPQDVVASADNLFPREDKASLPLVALVEKAFSCCLSNENFTEVCTAYPLAKGTEKFLHAPGMENKMVEALQKQGEKTQETLLFDACLAVKQERFISVARPLLCAIQTLDQADGDAVPNPNTVKSMLEDALVLLGNANMHLNRWRQVRYGQHLTNQGKKVLEAGIPIDTHHLFPSDFHKHVREEQNRSTENINMRNSRNNNFVAPSGLTSLGEGNGRPHLGSKRSLECGQRSRSSWSGDSAPFKKTK